MRVLLLLLLLCLSNLVYSDDYIYKSCVVLHIVDMLQTVEITKDNSITENNIILGRYPTENEVYVYMGSTLALGYFIHRILPKKYKHMFDVMYASTELSMILTNYSIGIRIHI